MNTIWIVLPILTLLMFDLGLALRFEDFGKVFRNPWPIAVALFGQKAYENNAEALLGVSEVGGP